MWPLKRTVKNRVRLEGESTHIENSSVSSVDRNEYARQHTVAYVRLQ
jgi:hypothetical protein